MDASEGRRGDALCGREPEYGEVDPSVGAETDNSGTTLVFDRLLCATDSERGTLTDESVLIDTDVDDDAGACCAWDSCDADAFKELE